ncbi:PREDICTED: protein FAM185A isoform X3 [Dipodomys ordii]|uniref:Protein FAM185A isoform X3 n=1 Tax=Dipodomys ordii TaxID=10020 RepID=A0A1S3GR22_DIPOR|nr:PREDICTED: protein FAM185A isoform X3 [Dipodomys ordii]
MFASCAGPGLGCLGRGLGRARAGRWTGRAFQGRLCSSAPEPDVLPPGPARRPLKEWTLLVSPFGRLRARLRCHLAVRPLDPLTFPDGDRVLVTVSGVEGGTPGLDSLQVQYDEALQEMAIVSDTIDPRASVEVNVPLKFDLNIKSLGSGCVKVQNIECDHCKIETEQGISFLGSVKTVTVDKLQGSSINISTEDGLLEAKYLYTESSFVSSAAGNIALGNVHGNIILQSKMGNITIDSSCGCLKATTQQGTIDVYVSQLGKVELKSHKGSVTVKVPSSLQTYLQLSGKEVDVNPEVNVQEMAKDHKDDGIIITGHIIKQRDMKIGLMLLPQKALYVLEIKAGFSP